MQTPISRDDDTVLNPKALELLQLSPEDLEAIYEETYRHLNTLLEMFYYDITPNEDDTSLELRPLPRQP